MSCGSEEDSCLVNSYLNPCLSWKNIFWSTAYLQTCSQELQQNLEWCSRCRKFSFAKKPCVASVEYFLPTKRIDSAATKQENTKVIFVSLGLGPCVRQTCGMPSRGACANANLRGIICLRTPWYSMHTGVRPHTKTLVSQFCWYMWILFWWVSLPRSIMILIGVCLPRNRCMPGARKSSVIVSLACPASLELNIAESRGNYMKALTCLANMASGKARTPTKWYLICRSMRAHWDLAL